MKTQVRWQPQAVGVDDGPHVVAIGGGHGLARTLEAIQTYAGSITAIVSIADDGGSSGRLVEGLPIPPPGDIRKALLSLADPSLFAELFAYRFDGADVAGHSLGNLLLAALSDLTGDFGLAVDIAGDLLGVRGRVIPASSRRLILEADIDDRLVSGQAAIGADPGTVRALRLLPTDTEPHGPAIEAIAAADQLVLAPGSLYTSLVAALLAPGVADAVNTTPAPVVWVMNLCTQKGETAGMTGLEHVRVLERFGGIRCGGTIVADRGEFPTPAGIDPLTVDMVDALEYGWSLCVGEVVDVTAEWPSHDPVRLGHLLSMFAR